MSEVRFRSISTSIKVRTQNLLKADDSVLETSRNSINACLSRLVVIQFLPK